MSCKRKVNNWRATVVLPEVNGLLAAQVSSRCIIPAGGGGGKDEEIEADEDRRAIEETYKEHAGMLYLP